MFTLHFQPNLLILINMAAESTRRFTKNLLKPGSAAEIRQTACNAVRHSAVTVSGPLLVSPFMLSSFIHSFNIGPLSSSTDFPSSLAMPAFLYVSVACGACLRSLCLEVIPVFENKSERVGVFF
uniref:Uncharacterized protein n=1 Tax=Poecilia latipinna TaxID=48699 RepID=A0A3B3VFI8_9TELE